MSLAKAVSDGLKNRECKRTALQEQPPVPYVPKKDKVQDAVTMMKGLQIKSSIHKDMALNFSMCNSGTKEAMLMHVTATLDIIKQRGHFQAYKDAQALYVAKKEAAKQARADLSLLDRAGKGSRKSKKSSNKAKEAKDVTKALDQEMQATFLADLKKAKEATKNAKGVMTPATNKMLVFYTGLPSV
jgi:hypothetical protein